MGQNTVGVQLYQQGRYAEALQQFESAKLADPTNADTYYNLASTYHKMGVAGKDNKLLEQSEALYNQCLDIAPNHVDCYGGSPSYWWKANGQIPPLRSSRSGLPTIRICRTRESS